MQFSSFITFLRKRVERCDIIDCLTCVGMGTEDIDYDFVEPFYARMGSLLYAICRMGHTKMNLHFPFTHVML